MEQTTKDFIKFLHVLRTENIEEVQNVLEQQIQLRKIQDSNSLQTNELPVEPVKEEIVAQPEEQTPAAPLINQTKEVLKNVKTIQTEDVAKPAEAKYKPQPRPEYKPQVRPEYKPQPKPKEESGTARYLGTEAKTSQGTGKRWKFDIVRDSNGFIQSIMAEQVKN